MEGSEGRGRGPRREEIGQEGEGGPGGGLNESQVHVICCYRRLFGRVIWGNRKPAAMAQAGSMLGGCRLSGSCRLVNLWVKSEVLTSNLLRALKLLVRCWSFRKSTSADMLVMTCTSWGCDRSERGPSRTIPILLKHCSR